MKLSELITTLQATLDEHGDTDEIALCFVIEDRPAHRLDVFGSVTVLHDTAEYPDGMAYLVADCNLHPARLTEIEPANARVERPCAASGARSARTTGCAAGAQEEK